MIEISTSILNINEENYLRKLYDLEVAKTDYFHIDVMDGKFVENNTGSKMLEYVNSIKSISNLPLDIHLMVEDTKEFIDEFISFNPCYITIHKEAFKDIEELKEQIEYIKMHGIKVGVAIKPETNLEGIYSILESINLILVMTVEPGKGGQKLIESTLEKIKKLYEYREYNNLNFLIEADGGINLDTILDVKEAGVDIAVCGSVVVNSDNYKDIINKLKKS